MGLQTRGTSGENQNKMNTVFLPNIIRLFKNNVDFKQLS